MKLAIKQTAYPNGDVDKYTNGMDKPKLLPHNHPVVLAMRLKRSVNEFKGCKSALEEAKRILSA